MGEVKQINIKNRVYFFYNYIIDLKDFHVRLLKLTKRRTETLKFTTLDTSQLKKLVIVRLFIA